MGVGPDRGPDVGSDSTQICTVNSDRWDLTSALQRGDTWRDLGVRTFTVDGPDLPEPYFRATALLALGL